MSVLTRNYGREETFISKAQEFIHITSGFHAQAGSEFHAKIENVNYFGCPSGMMIVNDPFGEQNDQSKNSDGDLNENNSAVQKLQFDIYPNPSSENSTIKIIGSKSMLKITIYDMMGKLVYLTEVGIGKVFNPNLEAGTYVIIMKSDNEIQKEKLIVN
jgi:Secretion system C-terminal sorting domain